MADLIIRSATLKDADQIQKIYKYYVENTTISFETTAPNTTEIKNRIIKTLQNYPYIVGVSDDEIIGYAYAGPFRQRQAYCKAVEMSLYLNKDIRGKGYGQLLYTELENKLIEQGYHKIVSIIESTNHGSLKFHEKNGFEKAGYLSNIGYKFGKWLDIFLLTKQINDNLF